MPTPSIQDFVTSQTGQQNVGDTPENKGQCVGLVEVWIDQFGLPHVWGNAADLLNNADPNYYTIVHNNLGDTSQFPPDGAVVVLGKPYGPIYDDKGNITGYDGHTGLSVGSDGTTLRLFEQNDPEGSTPHMQEYTYDACVGWLILKEVPTTPGLPANYPEIVHGSTQWDATVAKYMPQSDPTQTDFPALQAVIGGIQSTATAANNKVQQDAIDLAAANQQVENLTEKLATEESQRQDDAKTYTAQIDALKSLQPNYDKVLGPYKSQVSALQLQVKQIQEEKHQLAIELAQCQAGTPKLSWLSSILTFVSGLFKRR